MTRRHLPQEIVDHIVDHLRNDSETLKQCSLVSKSWVPRVQRNLFFEIRFKCSEDLEAWKRAFPDPANSPVYHTRSLVVACIDITAADVEAGGWIHAFSKVVRLEACRVTNVFTLICSLPHLEDLYMREGCIGGGNGHNTNFQPSTSPPLTGTLRLSLPGVTEDAIRQLLNLPNRIRPRKLRGAWHSKKEMGWIAALVKARSNALEYVDVRDAYEKSKGPSPSIDFSKATKLKEITLRPAGHSIAWVTEALKTIGTHHKDLLEVSIYPDFLDTPIGNYAIFRGTVKEDDLQRWVELDCVLIGLMESHAVRVEVIYHSKGVEEEVYKCMKELLPEITQRCGAGPARDSTEKYWELS